MFYSSKIKITGRKNSLAEKFLTRLQLLSITQKYHLASQTDKPGWKRSEMSFHPGLANIL
ncbi:MAG: hypothetical protein C0612_02805 [Desulfobulbaceae bacterium]|nr:MAG: hypothetical protein C0612_02805 [Desulfobulbaceae bacterium]